MNIIFKLFRLIQLALIFGIFLPLSAHAATQGLLGITSLATTTISITKSVQARITDVSDMTLSNWSIGDSDVLLYSNACVYSSTGSYKITATGSGLGGGFALVSGLSALNYSVTWNAGGAGNLASTGTALTAGAQSQTFATAATGSATCSGGGASNDTARVVVGITSSAMDAAASSAIPYLGILSLLITPI